MTNPKHAALYVRSAQDVDGTQTARQVQLGIALAEEHGWSIAETYVEQPQSGVGVPGPSLERMLTDVRSGLRDGVIVEDVTRLSRNETVGRQIASDLKNSGIELVLTRDGLIHL